MDYIVGLYFVWRVLLSVIAYCGSLILAFQPRFPYSEILLIPSGLPSWIWGFANFDGVHYLTIASTGYSAQYTQVFFPFYPIVIDIFHRFLPFIGPIIIGLVLSNAFFLTTLFVLRRLLKFDYNDQDIRSILLALLAFPTSFFFGSLYTESLFFLLTVLAFYFARKHRFFLSGFIAGISSATRLTGIFLLPALLWEWSHYKKLKFNKKIIIELFRCPALYLTPMGLLSYMAYLQLKFGDALYFWHVQPIFGAERSGQNIILLPQVLWRYMKMLGAQLFPPSGVSFSPETFLIVFLEAFFTLSAIGLLIIAHRKKIRTSYLIFSWLTVLLPTLTGTLSSMPRYVLVVFPIYIVLGTINKKYIRYVILTVEIILLIILCTLFTRGHWVS